MFDSIFRSPMFTLIRYVANMKFIVDNGVFHMDCEFLYQLFQVFLKAMAETGQVKLYGEHPTLTETSLYRARRHIFKEERYC